MTDVDRVTVISLERTPERFATFRDNNPALPIERFTAVDGQELDRWDCVDDGLITPGNPYTLGQLGNALSHITLWRRAAAETRALHIAEDDAIFRLDFIAMATAVIESLPTWDVVVWGWNFDWPMEIQLGPGLGTTVLTCNQDALREHWRSFVPSTIKPVPMRLLSNAGICAYSISPTGARRVLDRALPLAGEPALFPGDPTGAWINRTLDVELARHYPALDAFVTLPCLAVTLNVKAESTVKPSSTRV